MINQRILDSIGEIEQISNKLLKAKEKIKDEELESYELEYLRHLQWQHAIEMSKRYLV